MEFRNEIRATLNNILYHRGKLTRPINAVDLEGGTRDTSGSSPAPSPSNGDEDGPEDMMNYEQLQEMLAMMDKTGVKAVRFPRRNGFKPNGKKDEKRSPPTNGTRKCINCGGAHETRDCPKPQVSKEDRPCWRCGKTGHIGANCPNKPSGQKIAAMVATEPTNAGVTTR